ncbi:MAG: NAD-dependent epimerase/dehydratase family protein [Pelagibacteraceae bacterium TMED124]|nr:MAG: NAD-dependent epimerase/dehydratase family protein [Pelagibacteraceae bacterium TMED124]
MNLLEALSKTGFNKLIFSSSATVYGIPEFIPITEIHPLMPENVYVKLN